MIVVPNGVCDGVRTEVDFIRRRASGRRCHFCGCGLGEMPLTAAARSGTVVWHDLGDEGVDGDGGDPVCDS